MGASHEHGDDRTVSTQAPIAAPPAAARTMPFQRQVIFWLAALAVFILLLWLLSGILLPFVAGLAIAYLLNPLTDRLAKARHQPDGGRASDHHPGGAGLHSG